MKTLIALILLAWANCTLAKSDDPIVYAYAFTDAGYLVQLTDIKIPVETGYQIPICAGRNIGRVFLPNITAYGCYTLNGNSISFYWYDGSTSETPVSNFHFYDRRRP